MHISAMTNAQTFKLFLDKMMPGRRLKILDVGGLNVNGSVRPLFDGHDFCALDMEADPSVDVVSPPGEPLPFADGHFDAVVSTSCALADEGPTFSVEKVDLKRVTHLQTLGFRSKGGSNAKSFGYAKFISDDDCVLGDVLLKAHAGPREVTGYMRAGPRSELHFDPKETRAAIVTCGGLCPGLNSIVKNLVTILEGHYGIQKIYGVSGGYRGFTSVGWDAPVELSSDYCERIHHDGGTVLGTSRGGFDAEKIAVSYTHLTLPTKA